MLSPAADKAPPPLPQVAEPGVPAASSLAMISWIGFRTIVIREYSRIVRIWGQTMVPSGVNAVLYFVIFGGLIGRRVGIIGGFSYMQFLAPGMIMMWLIQNAYANTVSSFFGAKFGKHIEELLVSPLPNWIIVLGYTCGGIIRGVMVAMVVTIVSLFFARIPIEHPAAIVTAALLTSTAFSLAGLINAIFAHNFDQVNLVPLFVLTPLTYFGGVFYSVSMLPGWAQKVSLANPILYMVNAFRYGFLGVSDIDVPAAFGLMAGLALGLFITCMVLLNRGVGVRD